MTVSRNLFNTSQILLASEFVKQGKLLAYPTEAVWGIGCDPFNEAAVHQILTIKNRPIEKGMIVIAPNLTSIAAFFNNLPKVRQSAILESWHHAPLEKPHSQSTDLLPHSIDSQNSENQATTWLFPIPANLSVKIPDWVTGGRDSLAIRIIAQTHVRRLCHGLISPSNPYGFLISTSCNRSGELPAKTFAQAHAYFKDSVGYLLDETLHFTQPSQIKDAMTGELVRE